MLESSLSPTEVTGILSVIKFNQDGYVIGTLDVDGDEAVNIKGPMLRPEKGLEYTVMGRWEVHPKWGKQLSFSDYRVRFPSSIEAIEGYLVENCMWVGNITARKIIDAFGSETLSILKSNPELVADKISGITKIRADEISKRLKKIEEEEAIDLSLRDVLSGTRIPKRSFTQIKELWGLHAVEMIKLNPFDLVDKIDGIGFNTADQIAKHIGYDHFGPARIEAGIIYVMNEQSNGEGHVCVPRSIVIEKAMSVLSVESRHVEDRLVILLGEGVLVESGDKIYTAQLYAAEIYIAEKMKALLAYSGKRVEAKPNTDDLMDDQIEAINQIVKNGIFLLTGAPGTGKTRTVKAIIDSFPNAKIALAAPTGKAAKRMAEQCGSTATTVHKLLGARPNDRGDFTFEFGEHNPIDADLIVLDEVSMMGTRLMASFLRAVVPSTRLVFVGDFNQLPSVDAGNVLRNFINSGMIPMMELTKIKRQDPGLIILNCHQIKNGRDIIVNNEAEAKDFFFLERESTEEIQSTIVDLVEKRLAKTYDVMRDVQVITALREKTILSGQSLNEILQEKLNPNPPFSFSRFRLGDKVIQLRNTSVHNELTSGQATTLANGDIGYVVQVDEVQKKLIVEFDSPKRLIAIDATNNRLDLAYALTVHKYQGSEAPVIVIPIHRSAGPMLLQRNWLYTATSRARKMCILVGQRGEVPQIIARKNQQVRYSKLAEFLKERN